MKIRIQLILLLTIININAFSQSDYKKGYIQISEQDTIFGLINYKNDISNHKVCVFKKDENDTVQKYLPEKIYGYKFIDGKYYVSKEIETKNGLKTIFLEYLLKGTVNLFFYRDNFDHYLIQKNEMPIKEISYEDEIIYNNDNIPCYRKYMINRGLIRYYLQDCPELFGDIDYIKKPSHSELIKLIKKYHELKCPDGVCIIYKRKLPKFRIDLQPVYGFTKLSKEVAIDLYSKAEYTNQYGLLTYIWMPLTNERVFFKSGILYSKIKDLEDVNSDYSESNFFKVPLQFQYVFLKNRISPTFGGGLNVVNCYKYSLLILPALNVGLNININKKIYISLYSDIDYFGKFYFIPDKSTIIISNSFTFGLTIKI